MAGPQEVFDPGSLSCGPDEQRFVFEVVPDGKRHRGAIGARHAECSEATRPGCEKFDAGVVFHCDVDSLEQDAGHRFDPLSRVVLDAIDLQLEVDRDVEVRRGSLN